MAYQESHKTDDVSVTISTKFMQFGSIYLLEDLQSAGTFLVKTVSEDILYVDCCYCILLSSISHQQLSQER